MHAFFFFAVVQRVTLCFAGIEIREKINQLPSDAAVFPASLRFGLDAYRCIPFVHQVHAGGVQQLS